MEIRRALPADAATLTRIAMASKRHWRYPERWIELWTEALTITPELVLQKEVFAAATAEAVAGFYALSGRERPAVLEHLWVHPDHIGTGVGRALFDHAMERAASLGAEVVEIESDPHAEGFYLRMGARRVGEQVTSVDGQPRSLPLLRVEVAWKQRQGGKGGNTAADLHDPTGHNG